MYLLPVLTLLPLSWAFYDFKGSPIEMINYAKWKTIANGEDPYVWMINFYCKTNGTKCARSYEMKNEYTDAVTILSGLVKPAAYEVSDDFLAFVRIPSVMLYVPNSTEPYVFEMENYPEQVKRPGFRLVHFAQDVVVNHIRSDQVRNVVSSWKLNQIRTDWMTRIIDIDVPNQCSFVLVYDDFKNEDLKIQLLASVATVVYHVHGISEKMINFGVTNFRQVKKAFDGYAGQYTAPKFIFFGTKNAATHKQVTFSYDGRMDVADMTRWVISRYADMMVLPADVVQINVKREAGFVGQVFEIEDKKLIIGII